MIENEIQVLLFFLLGFGLAAVAALILFVWHNQKLRLRQNALDAEINLLSAAFYGFPQPMCVTTLEEGIFLDINQAFEQDMGWARSEIIGKSALELGIWKNGQEREAYKQRLCSSRKLLFFMTELCDIHDKVRYSALTGHIFTALDSKTPLILAALSDRTVQKHVEYMTNQENSRFREFFHHMRDAAVRCDKDGYFIECNRAFMDSLGYTAEELKRMTPRKVTPEEFHERDISFENGLITGDRPFVVYEKEHIKKDGTHFPIELQLYIFKDAEGNSDGFWGVIRDLSDKQQQQEKEDFLANHDALTGLPNRIQFIESVKYAIAHAKQNEDRKLALILINLDRFKTVNETLGFQAGDALLCAVAEQLKKLLRSRDTLARIGGDEFVIMLEDLIGTPTISIIVERLNALFQKPLLLEGQEIYLTASVGISIYPDHGDGMDALLKCADIAALKAKELGRNTWQFYEHNMSGNISERLQLSNSLRNALQNQELLLCYQPLLEIATDKLVGVEALVRWRHPEHGIMLPDDFIPLAEDMGIISNIDSWVLQEACKQMRYWQEKGFNVPRISVNLSVQQLERPDFVDFVRQQLEENNLKPELLQLEITESTLMQRFGRALQHLLELRTMGVSLSVDDFGTGYSSLGNLKKVPVHQLKIDYSFIHDIGRNKNDEAITSAIIAMAKSLDLEVVAEGIERQEQKAFLLSAGCQIAQGFYYDKAMPADRLQAQWGRGED